MDIAIREVRPDDAEGIVRFMNPIIEAGVYTVLDAPFTVESEREYIAGFAPRGVFHVAVWGEQQRIVGMQSLEVTATYTAALAHVAEMGTWVDLALRRHGIGLRLWQATLPVARQRGFEKILTYVRADNPGALGFYRRLGFRVVGTAERHARFGRRYVDEVIIERLL